MLNTDVKGALLAVANDWRATHQAGGDCIDFANELMQIMLPLINRSEMAREDATLMVIHAGNYADGSNPVPFMNMLDAL